MKSNFYRSTGLRVGFPKGVNAPGPVTRLVVGPEGTMVTAAVESRLERAEPTHAELNTALSRSRGE